MAELERLVWPTKEGHLALLDARTGTIDGFLALSEQDGALGFGNRWHGAGGGVLACSRDDSIEFWRPRKWRANGKDTVKGGSSRVSASNVGRGRRYGRVRWNTRKFRPVVTRRAA